MAPWRLRTWTCVTLLGAVLLAPGLAMAQSKGVPDAPPVDHILARHGGFTFPKGFETSDGRRLPKGTYDLLLIESGARYYIQLMNTETLRGIRVAAEATGQLLLDATGTRETSVHIRSEEGRDTFHFTMGEFTVAFPLSELRKAS